MGRVRARVLRLVLNPGRPRSRFHAAWLDTLQTSRFLAFCCGVLAACAALRWILAITVYLRPNSDQVMVGLIARRILAGARPVFYWGQPYNGTLESFITAGIFRVFGESYQALHVAPVLFSVIFVAAVMALSAQLYGRAASLVTGMLLVPAPALLMEFSVWSGYNYLQAMAFGTLALALLLRFTIRRSWVTVPPAAFLLGLAIWAQPLAVVYLPAALALFAGPCWRALSDPRLQRSAIVSLLLSSMAFLAGLWPVISYNLAHQWATLRFLGERPNNMHLTHLEETRRLLFWAVPVFTGLIPPTEVPEDFTRFLSLYPFVYAVALALPAVAVALIIRRRHTIGRWFLSVFSARPAGEAALLVLALTLVTAYLTSSWSSSRWSATEPRYLLPLFTLAPLLQRALFPAHAERRRLLLGGVIALTMTVGGLTSIGHSAPDVPDARPLARYLTTEGATAVYGDYWVVYTLAFASHEQLLPVVVKDDLSLGLNRYQPYLDAGVHSARRMWVAGAGTELQQTLERCLAARGLQYRSTLVALDGGPCVVTEIVGNSPQCT